MASTDFAGFAGMGPTDPIRVTVDGALPSHVDSVVRGARRFVESGEPVVRNQFGPHAIFSPDRAPVNVPTRRRSRLLDR